LDNLSGKPVDEALRQLGAHTRLALDVLSFDERLRSAVHYVVGNSLICDSVDMARRLAFGPDRHDKVIALDGTCVRRSGLISGGLASLQSKASRWNEKKLAGKRARVSMSVVMWFHHAPDAHLIEVSKRRDEVVAALAEVAVAKREAVDEAPLVAQLEGLESRLKYAGADLSETRERLKTARGALKRVATELATSEKAVVAARKALTSVDAEKQKAEAALAAREAAIFGAFSKKIGVDDIRAYEAARADAAQRHAEAAVARDAQRARLAQQIEFERSRDLAAPLERLRARLADERTATARVNAELKQASKRAAADAHQAAADALAACADATRADRELAADAAARLADAQKALAQAVRCCCCCCCYCDDDLLCGALIFCLF
jgi:structural maintenance of chromosome 1